VRQVRRVGGVDYGVEPQLGQGFPRPDVLESQRPGEGPRSLAATHQVDIDTLRCGDLGDEQPIAPVPSTSNRSPAQARPHEQRGVHCRRVRPGPQRRPDPLGQWHQSPDGHRKLLGQRARPAVSDPDLVPVGTEVLASMPAPLQLPQPSIVSPVTRRPTHEGSTPSPTEATTPAPIRGRFSIGVPGQARVQIGISPV